MAEDDERAGFRDEEPSELDPQKLKTVPDGEKPADLWAVERTSFEFHLRKVVKRAGQGRGN